MLELGRHLVRELDLQDTNDTLGRWMAHHLAEEMRLAEDAPTHSLRSKARKSAIEIILKIWSAREKLRGNAYPLAPYKEALYVLTLMRPDSNPYRFLHAQVKFRRNEIAARLFDNISRLMLAILLMDLPAISQVGKKPLAAVKALTPEERQILLSFHSWSELFNLGAKTNVHKRSGARDRKGPEVDLRKAALGFIDSSNAILLELKGSLTEKNEKGKVADATF